MNKIIIAVWVLLAIGCNNARTSPKPAAADKISADTMNDPSLVYREKAAENAAPKAPGELTGRIACKVRTKNLKDYEDGIIPYISLDSTQKEIKQLIDKDNIVVPEKKVTVIIDYPLSIEHKFEMTSTGGFTRQQLVEAISKEYHRIYEEEEATAKTKTLPLAQRKIYNRNQTDGKYGIWGHDLGDLVLDEILVYKAADGQIILTLEIES